jgi:acyl-CoA synthetase (NDP forming)
MTATDRPGSAGPAPPVQAAQPVDRVDRVDRLGRLGRLLAPRHLVVFGSDLAAEVIKQSRLMGFSGEIWPVHPTRRELAGIRCLRSIDDLPQPPDAAFVAVPADATIEVVAELARIGAGGAVCYASGFAEIGPQGAARQQRLVDAAGELALIGPNCYGLLNYLDGAALWPDGHGGRAVDRGVAIITQSGNLGLNLTMQQRGLPIAYLVAGGNFAVSRLDELMLALLDDSRVTAIGLHIEGLTDVAAFSRAAVLAHQRRIPLVALKSGSSAAGARVTLSHTSSLSGADVLYDALFDRLGIARVHDPAVLLETLMLLHVHGGLPGTEIASASCSGGEASLVADLADRQGLLLPELGEPATAELTAALGERVAIGNPLDYHTYIWGDRAAQTACFTGLLRAPVDLGLLVLDLPRDDRCAVADWITTLDAFVAAQRATGTPAAVVSSLPESLPEPVADRLLADGIAVLRGLESALVAVAAAARIGRSWQRPVTAIPGPIGNVGDPVAGAGAIPESLAIPVSLGEWQAKQVLAGYGLPVPVGMLIEPADPVATVAAAERLGYPVVLKAIGAGLEHKSEQGAVTLGLARADQVTQAARRLTGLAPALLLEAMVTGAVAELIVGIRHDPQFGYALTVGAGGVLVELLQDSVTLLLPVTPEQVHEALRRLRIAPVLAGYRGRPAADLDAVVAAVTAVIDYVQAAGGAVTELDVNPLLALPAGAVAVDALIVCRPQQRPVTPG